MPDDDQMAICTKLDELIAQLSDAPQDALACLMRKHGATQTACDARIVIGSWRTRIDLIEDTREELLAGQEGYA